MVTLSTIKDSVNSMPENASIDDVIERLIYLQKIDEALLDVQNGNVHSHQEMKEYVKKWSKNNLDC
jgi:predicted CopG family antitoxin